MSQEQTRGGRQTLSWFFNFFGGCGGDIPFYPGQEPDPTRGRRECQAELHRSGWWEALCGDRIRCAATVRVPKPHWTAQGDGKWCLKLSSLSCLGGLGGHTSVEELAEIYQEFTSPFSVDTINIRDHSWCNIPIKRSRRITWRSLWTVRNLS